MLNGTTLNVNSDKPRLVFVVNSALAVGFLQGQMQYFQRQGFDVAVVCPKRKQSEWEVPKPEGVSIIEVDMERNIAPLLDIVSLWRLWRIIRALRPAVTNVGTPKAGLLGGLAAWLNRVPCRYYTLHGLRFETTKGLRRRLLIFAERLACRFAHRVICVSQSTREKAITSGLTSEDRTVVFGSGSCNGVDCSRFAPTPKKVNQAAALRCQLGIPVRASVVAFVGRLTVDKGIPELAEAFFRLDAKFPDLWLLLVGCFEDGDPLPVYVRKRLESHPRVIFSGPVRDTSIYYATSDVLVLPSHREGLPTVILEAQAAGVPVVGSSATGIVDAVMHGETGLLFPTGDVSALAETLARLITDNALAARLGRAGRESVNQRFRQERVWEAHLREYIGLLQTNEPNPFSVRKAGEQTRLVVKSNE
jgi:glycosyltransferase involved in cell wall biosynthesis